MDRRAYMAISGKLDFKKRPWLNIAILAGDLALLATATHLLTRGNLFYFLLAQLLLVTVFFHAFALLHEASHGIIANKKAMNQIMGNFCGLLCFLPFESWKIAHLQHHAWSGNVNADPVMRLVKNFNPDNKLQVGAYNVIWRSWIPILAVLQHLVFWFNALLQMGDPTLNVKSRAKVAVSCFLPIGAYTLLFISTPVKITDILPALVIYMAVTEMINFPHHLGKEQIESGREPPYNQHRFTRSCYYPPVLAKGFFLNFNFHIEHHLFPALPWFNLAEARPLLKEALGTDYEESHFNSWMRKNRKMDIRAVVIPTKVDEDHSPEERKAS